MKWSESPCTPWTGNINKQGYGRVWVYEQGARKLRYAHRAEYEKHVGPIPEGLTIDHLCRNTKCVNVLHLEVVTLSENVRRISGDNSHCKRGHEFNAENTYYLKYQGNGRRSCKACHRDYERNRKRALPKAPPGARSRASATLTEPQVLAIRSRYAEGAVTQSALAREYGITHTAVNLIVHRKTWTYL